MEAKSASESRVLRDWIMIKNSLFAVALVSLALANGCAKGGNGTGPPPATVDVSITSPSNVSASAIYPTQTVTLTAAVSNSTKTAVTWSLSGPGTLTPVTPPTTPATATYVGPAAAGSATVTAALISSPSVTGSLALKVVDITTVVSPAAVTMGSGLTQQFTAINVPDDAPQTFNWTCTVSTASPQAGPYASSNACATFISDGSGVATYTANDNCTGNCVTISASSTLDPNFCSASPQNCTSAKISVVSSRVTGTYAFHFSGYDSAIVPAAVAVSGTFTATNGTITSGVEEELTSAGPVQHSITGGSYTPSSVDPNNSNETGTLALTLPANIYPNKFQVVLDGSGDIQMIEGDGQGTGSGIAERTSSSSLFTGTQTYAFGFTGMDLGGHHVGYAGVFSMIGNGTSGTIAGGQMDVNGAAFCASPCAASGSYTFNPASNMGQISLTLPVPLVFDFFIASGQSNKTNPLTLYAITDQSDPTHPLVSGMMVLQDSTETYNNAAFSGTTVSALTGTGPNGTNTNVSLTLGTADGKGNFSGQFDQNNAGTILSAVQFPPAVSKYTYAASGTNGRYTFQMLGNPNASPAVAPLTFILYATGANRGFLLDQSSSSVMTGTMNPQGKGSGAFAASELSGPYAAATTSNGSPGVTSIAANLVLTSPGNGVFNVSGTEYPGTQAVTGLYTLSVSGNGTIQLSAALAQNYVIYVQDTVSCSGQGLTCAIQDFYMMDTDSSNPNASIIFAQQ
jgi:hypothetical protein